VGEGRIVAGGASNRREWGVDGKLTRRRGGSGGGDAATLAARGPPPPPPHPATWKSCRVPRSWLRAR